jgi:hypothetical protein
MQILQLVEHQFVDEVAARFAGEDIIGNLVRIGTRQPSDHDATVKPRGDGSAAVADDRSVAVVVDLRDGFVRRGELRPLSDVFGVPVRVVGEHDELLFLADGQPHVFGQHFDPRDSRVVTGWRLCSATDPFGENPIAQRVRVESQPAFVRQGSGWFGEKQAAAGIAEFDAAAASVLDDREVIGS